MSDRYQSRLSETPPASAPLRNPVTHEKHRREVSRQVFLPLIIGVVLLCVASGFVAYVGLAGTGDVSRWADISLIWLILPAMIATLVFLALLVGLVAAVTWMLGKLPPLARQVQDFMARVNFAVHRGADAAASPFMRVRGMSAAWRRLRTRLFP